MRKIFFLLGLGFICSCGVVEQTPTPTQLKVRSFNVKIIDDVATCKSLLDDKSLRPQVCGKCNLRFEGKSLRIEPAEGCPPYEALGCTSTDGKVFVINNVSCAPIAEGSTQTHKEERGGNTYRVRVEGEDCIAYIRAKRNVRILYTKDYGGRFDVRVQTDENTIKDISLMGCVRDVEKE